MFSEDDGRMLKDGGLVAVLWLRYISESQVRLAKERMSLWSHKVKMISNPMLKLLECKSRYWFQRRMQRSQKKWEHGKAVATRACRLNQRPADRVAFGSSRS